MYIVHGLSRRRADGPTFTAYLIVESWPNDSTTAVGSAGPVGWVGGWVGVGGCGRDGGQRHSKTSNTKQFLAHLALTYLLMFIYAITISTIPKAWQLLGRRAAA